MVSTKFKMVLRNNVIALPVINRQPRLLTQHLYVQALDIGVISDMPSHMIDALLTALDEKVEQNHCNCITGTSGTHFITTKRG